MELTIEQALERGAAFHQEGKLQEAERIYRAILQFQPEHPDANHNLGIIAGSRNEIEEALSLFETALEANPKIEQFWLSYLDVLIKQKRFEQAKQVLLDAKKAGVVTETLDRIGEQLMPSQAKLSSLSECYKSGQYDVAEQLALMLTQEFPSHQFGWKILGAIFGQTDRDSEAVNANQTAVKLSPQDAEAHNNLGINLKELGRLDEAEASYRKAVELRPDFSEAHYNLGINLKVLGKLEEALVSYNKAIELKADFSDAYSNKNFCLNYSSLWSPVFIYKQHLKFEKQFGGLKAETPPSVFVKRNTGQRLRIGYVSADFRQHSVSYFFEPLLQHHSEHIVETFCYYNNKVVDATTKRLMAFCDHWRSTFGIIDLEVANLVRRDKIDILVDLSGHTANNRLLVFAHKPAPIQVTWLGYPNTTGLSAIDYRFTDIIADPIGEADELHSETLFRLPNGFQCYQGNEKALVGLELPQSSQGYITFGSFNNFSKITPQVIKAWSKILHAVPRSYLLLKSSDNHNKNYYLELFKKEGLAEDRINLYQRLPKMDDHLALYNKIDICLDSFPFNGATTTCEALWMGIPVITLSGDRHAARVGASILTNVGLTDFIAQDVDGYIQLAVQMASKTDYLKQLRKDLRERMQGAPLCDARSFASDVEGAYQEMWRCYQK